MAVLKSKHWTVRFSKPVFVLVGRHKVVGDSLLLAHNTPLRCDANISVHMVRKDKTFVLECGRDFVLLFSGGKHKEGFKPHAALIGLHKESVCLPVFATGIMDRVVVNVPSGVEVRMTAVD